MLLGFFASCAQNEDILSYLKWAEMVYWYYFQLEIYCNVGSSSQ